MRQIVLDTETTGLDVKQGHRIIEIGCVELLHRRPTRNDFHRYLNPQRAIDPGAMEVHGITDERVRHEPPFAEIAQTLWQYLEGAELIIHNASFDIGFLDEEFGRCGFAPLSSVCTITDTVAMARRLHPGQKVNLDALCKRYNVDNSRRQHHGAALDASLLADVYLAMTGGQSRLSLDSGAARARQASFAQRLGVDPQRPLPVIRADAAEQQAHQQRLAAIARKAGRLLWQGETP
ncbi:MAG TPA: DNA polymerase III subunit epsilon [Nevskiaceae bacterium]|nr:DNA polymerase III subunit epsilon [Nevskiaceae bacterium]